MTITREEFKELVTLYNETWEKSEKYKDYINEELLGELLFSSLDWMRKKLGICDEDFEFDLLTDLHLWNNAPVSWKTDENGYVYSVEYSSDLDKIYDAYLA